MMFVISCMQELLRLYAAKLSCKGIRTGNYEAVLSFDKVYMQYEAGRAHWPRLVRHFN